MGYNYIHSYVVSVFQNIIVAGFQKTCLDATLDIIYIGNYVFQDTQ